MARSSSTVLAALLAAMPVVATAQTSTPATDTAAPAADAATATAAPAADAAVAPAAGADSAASTDAATNAADPTDAAATADNTASAPAAPAASDQAAQPSDSTAAPADAGAQADAAAAPADTAAPADAAAAPATGNAEGGPGTAQAAPAANPAPAQGGDQVGSYYTKSTHDDWLLRCLKTPDGKDPCELYQLLKDQADKPVAEVSVIPFSGKAAAIVNFVAPLETDLQGGLGLKIDAGKDNRYPFLVCVPVGCISRVGMTDAEVGALKSGSKATVSLLPFGADPAKDQVGLDMSLKGFTAGFTALQDAVKAEQQTPKN